MRDIETANAMVRSVWRLVLLGIVAMCCAKTEVYAAVVLYDMNTAGQLDAAFDTPYSGTPVSQQVNGGLDNSGSINMRSGDGNQAWFSDAYYSTLNQGQELSVSLYFKFDGNATTSVKLGFATDPNASVNTFAMPTSGSWGYFSVWTVGGNAGINSELWSSKGSIGSPGAASGSFVDGNWYYSKLALTLVDAGTSNFEFEWLFANSDSSGNLGSTLISGTSQNVFPELNTQLYTYMGLENPTASSSYTALDNIELTSDGQIYPPDSGSVPEPSGLVLLALGAAGILALRQKSRGNSAEESFSA
jgi:hypothetical protein